MLVASLHFFLPESRPHRLFPCEITASTKCVYEIEVDSDLREIVNEDIQDTVDSAVMNGHAKIQL